MTKFYIDSNIFIRFLTYDIKESYLKASRLIKEVEESKAVGIISILVINEVLWILENYYSLKRKIFINELMKILSLKNIKILEVRKKILFNILEAMVHTRIDFTDYYLKEVAGKQRIVSFDKDFTKIVKEKRS